VVDVDCAGEEHQVANENKSDKQFPSWEKTQSTDDAEAAVGVSDDEHEDETGVDGPSLTDQLAAMTAERDEYLDQLQRSRAEFVNFRRRNEQERNGLRQFVSRDVLAQFLPAIDDLARALAAIPETERESSWVAGVNMIQTKLNGTMDRLGVSKVEALGKPFDPSIHESVATEPGTSGAGVIEVYQSGYRIGEVLVRPAMVKTGDLPQDDGSDNETEQSSFDA
jgi:molecular chaperone GrpE